MVFRATRKLMLWYLEQQETSRFVFRATRKSMLKVIRATKKIHAPVSGTVFIVGNLGVEPNFPTKLEKNKNANLINALIGSIFWNKNISCHNTFKAV